MKLPPSDATLRALDLIGKPRDTRVWTAFAAAKECGVSVQTLYKHLKRRRKEAREAARSES